MTHIQKIRNKYGSRTVMSKECERLFVNDCFEAYERDGFAEKFHTPYADYQHLNGLKFKVLRRCTEGECLLSTLPIWKIQFENGLMLDAFPEEIAYNG